MNAKRVSAILISALLFSFTTAVVHAESKPAAPQTTVGNIAGQWKGSYGDGKTFTADISQNGTSFNIRSEISDGSKVTSQGTITGNTFSGRMLGAGPDQPSTFTGTLDGDKITGSYTSKGATGTWSGTRVMQ